MTLRRLVIPVLAVALTAYSCAGFAVAAATVNGDKITESQVEEELDRVRSDPTFQDLLAQQADNARGLARREILSALVRQEVLGQEANRLGIKVRPEQIDSLLTQEAQRAGMTPDEFLEAQNLSRADISKIAERVVREFELRDRVVTDVRVKPSQIQGVYDTNEDAFAEAQLDRITVRTADEARRALEEVGNSSFAQVAEERSIDEFAGRGGEMGYVALSELSPFARQAIEQATIGGLTDPVQASGGFEVYRVRDRRVRPFEEVSEVIEAQLLDQARTAKFEEWVSERVRSAEIVVNPKYGRFDKDSARIVPGTGELRE